MSKFQSEPKPFSLDNAFSNYFQCSPREVAVFYPFDEGNCWRRIRANAPGPFGATVAIYKNCSKKNLLKMAEKAIKNERPFAMTTHQLGALVSKATKDSVLRCWFEEQLGPTLQTAICPNAKAAKRPSLRIAPPTAPRKTVTLG